MHTPTNKMNLHKYFLSEDGRELCFTFEGIDEQLALAGGTVWAGDYEKTKRYRKTVKEEFLMIMRAVNAHARLIASVERQAFLLEQITAGDHQALQNALDAVTEARALLAELEGKE